MADGEREVLEYDAAGSGLILQLPALWLPYALTTVDSGNSWEHHTGILGKSLCKPDPMIIWRPWSRTNSRAFINWIKLTTVNNPTFFLKYHLCLRFEWIESGNIFYFGITSKDRPWPRTAPPAPLFNFHWISVSSWLIVQDETRNNMCYFPVPTVSFYSSCLCNLHTQLFLGTCRDLVVGFPLNTKVHRCSSTLFKMAQHFHVHNSNLHNSPVCLNSSLDF